MAKCIQTSRWMSGRKTNWLLDWHLNVLRVKRCFNYGFSFAGTGSGAASWKSRMTLKIMLIFKTSEWMNDWMDRWIKYEISALLNEWDLKQIEYYRRMNEWIHKWTKALLNICLTQWMNLGDWMRKWRFKGINILSEWLNVNELIDEWVNGRTTDCLTDI